MADTAARVRFDTELLLGDSFCMSVTPLPVPSRVPTGQFEVPVQALRRSLRHRCGPSSASAHPRPRATRPRRLRLVRRHGGSAPRWCFAVGLRPVMFILSLCRLRWRFLLRSVRSLRFHLRADRQPPTKLGTDLTRSDMTVCGARKSGLIAHALSRADRRALLRAVRRPRLVYAPTACLSTAPGKSIRGR